MSVKEIIIIVVAYCGKKLIDKFIDDNLQPNLKYKNIIAAFKKHVIPVLLIGALGYYGLLAKISKDKEVEKTFVILLAVVVATMAMQNLAQNKKLSVSN